MNHTFVVGMCNPTFIPLHPTFIPLTSHDHPTASHFYPTRAEATQREIERRTAAMELHMKNLRTDIQVGMIAEDCALHIAKLFDRLFTGMGKMLVRWSSQGI